MTLLADTGVDYKAEVWAGISSKGDIFLMGPKPKELRKYSYMNCEYKHTASISLPFKARGVWFKEAGEKYLHLQGSNERDDIVYRLTLQDLKEHGQYENKGYLTGLLPGDEPMHIHKDKDLKGRYRLMAAYGELTLSPPRGKWDYKHTCICSTKKTIVCVNSGKVMDIFDMKGTML